MKKLLVSGAGGFVGARIMTQLAGRYELCAFPKGMLAAADEQTVADWVRREQPDVIVHTAALSDTGYSEKHPDESYRANVLLPCWMAAAAQKSGAKLVAFSSDQVYTGLTEHGPFDEDTPLSPANVYGRHKQEMEQRVLDILPDAVLLRAAWMYDLPGYGLPIRGNFLLNLLTAAMRQETLRFSAWDYRGITYVREAVERLTQAMELPGGVYNFGSENDCDMVTTARRACELLDIHPVIEAADWPRSLLMDGGRGQVSAAKDALAGTALADVPLYGMVKDDHHRTRAIVDSDGREIAINMNRGTFTFITAIQDETHRFANAYRKQQMKQKSYSSTLTEVPGVGPKTAKALLTQFKSVGAVKDATPDQLENTPGVGRQLAQTIYDYFHREA